LTDGNKHMEGSEQTAAATAAAAVAAVSTMSGNTGRADPKTGLRSVHARLQGANLDPPYSLVRGDRFNLALGMLIASTLAAAKDCHALPRFVRWNLRTFTFWNWVFCLARVVFRQRQWDPFLAVNSMGICFAFRTALTQRLDENMRKKLRVLGLHLSRPVFIAADHFLHTIPPIVLIGSLVHRRKRISRVVPVYTMALISWFSFRQRGCLDMSNIYVPHPFIRSYLALVSAELVTPPLVDALIRHNRRRVLLLCLALLLPYLSTRLDPGLRDKYNFEAAVARRGSPDGDASPLLKTLQRGAKGLPRVISDSFVSRFSNIVHEIRA